jgi:ribosomal protein S4
MLEKLYDMGILSSVIKLSEVERKVGVSRMARRRVGVVMTRLGMADTVTAAVKFVEQGHVRVRSLDVSSLIAAMDSKSWTIAPYSDHPSASS